MFRAQGRQKGRVCAAGRLLRGVICNPFAGVPNMAPCEARQGVGVRVVCDTVRFRCFSIAWGFMWVQNFVFDLHQATRVSHIQAEVDQLYGTTFGVSSKCAHVCEHVCIRAVCVCVPAPFV